MDAKISYTMLNTLRKCKQRWHLTYQRKVLNWDRVDQRPFLVGTVVDYLFKEWILKGYPEGWMEYKAEDLFIWFAKKKRVVYKNQDDKGKMIFKTKNACRRLENASYNLYLPDKEIEPQKRLKMSREGFDWTAKLDMWIPKEKAVWDLKVTKSKKWLDPFQLYFFAWFMEQTGEEVEKLAFLSPLMSHSLIEYDWTVVERHAFEKELFELLSIVKEGTKWERNAKDCFSCPVWNFCEDSFEVAYLEKKKGGGFNFDVR